MTSKAKPGRPHLWLGAAMIAVSAGAALALLIAPSLSPVTPVDPSTGCRLDGETPAHTLILVDATEPLAARHKRILAAAVAHEQRRLPHFGRLSVVALDAETPEEPPWLTSLCSPGDGSDANPIFANPTRLRQRWNEAFVAPIDEAARRAGAHAEEKASPLIETIGYISRDPRFQDAPARRLVLISDLMQYAPEKGVSLYDPSTRFEAARDHIAKLDGVTVQVALLDRPRQEAAQTTVWERFWAPWLAQSGARVEGAP